MRNLTRFGLVSLLGLLSFFHRESRAQDILSTAATTFFDSEDRLRRVGIEMELSGLKFEELIPIVQKYYAISRIEVISATETFLHIPEGVIKLKVEGQAWRFEGDEAKYATQLAEDLKIAPREIVFPPLTYQRAETIQNLARDLALAGGQGTTAERAVAFQVNAEIGKLRDDERRVREIVNLLRTYYDTDNMKQIDEVLKVPSMRREYLNDLTPGYRKLLFRADYSPSLEEFFHDYLYRQSAERFGYGKAWTADIPELRQFLETLKDPVNPIVVKMQRVRISSLLLEAFPDDWLTKEIVKSRWAVPAPIVEFREFNMIFAEVDNQIRASQGLLRSVKKYGYYKHDRLMSTLTGIPKKDFPRIRRKVAEGKPFTVRYLLEDPKKNPLTAEDMRIAGSNALWIQLSPENPGTVPLVVGGESTVFNRRHIHRRTILGKYNPGLDHGYIQQAVENKLTEAKLLGLYVPGAMPEFAALRSLTKEAKVSPKEAFRAASKKFPNGWVMKGSWDLGSEKAFISNRIDIDKAMRDYANGFEDHRRQVLEKYAGQDPELVAFHLKKHPGYQGGKIKSLLESPNQVFFQELMPIDREFRVEILNGKVIPGATIDRYAYMNKRAKPPTAAEISAIDEFTQRFIDSLPEEMRVLPYGLDIARLKTGGFKIVETNPGGNSSFLEESVPSVKAFESALEQYRLAAVNGELKRLTPRQEMTWLKSNFKRLGISPEKDYPGMIFSGEGIFDPEYLPAGYCRELLQPADLIPWSR